MISTGSEPATVSMARFFYSNREIKNRRGLFRKSSGSSTIVMVGSNSIYNYHNLETINIVENDDFFTLKAMKCAWRPGGLLGTESKG